MQTTEAFLAVFETEPWNTIRAASPAPGETRPLEREGFVVAANWLYSLISVAEDVWQASVTSGRSAYREADDRHFDDLYRRWLEVCDKTIAAFSVTAPGDWQEEGLDELLRKIEAIRCLLESRELEATMRPIDEILPLARGNPRPERYGL